MIMWLSWEFLRFEAEGILPYCGLFLQRKITVIYVYVSQNTETDADSTLPYTH